MNSDLKITLSRVLEKPLQINGTDTETHYINELFKRLVFHELLNKLNLKCYFIRQFIEQKLLELNENITRYEIITGKPLTKEYIRFFNEPKKQYELTIKNYLQWKI